MEPEPDGTAQPSGDLIIPVSVGKHLALAPVAFAVSEGPAHTLVYANALFRRLQEAGKISIGRPAASAPLSAADLTPLLDQVFRSGEIVRDAKLEPPDSQAASWSCTVWPVPDSRGIPEKLVIELRDIALIESTRARQRAIAERLLLGALREQDVARDAVSASDRADYLAKTSQDLSMSLDEAATRETVRQLAFPRPGTWCIVDVVESNGAIQRLAVVHPDPAKQALARQLERAWSATTADAISPASVLPSAQPTIITHESRAALMRVAHDAESLGILEQIGFDSLLIVPLIVRARVQGAITFVSRAGDPPFTSGEIALAVEVAARCAMALENARLYREADTLRLAAELANQSKSEFLGSVSHELRTPLNAIGGYTELIQMGIEGPVTERQQIALARIKANEEHLLKLITEILDFVRIEGGRMEYHNAAVSMMEALHDVAGMLTAAINEKGLTVEGPRGEPNAVAWADPDRVRQILINIVMNAVKYMPPNGGTIALSCAAVGDRVDAHVEDTGPGIPSEKLESIFEPFVQLKAGLRGRAGGIGLGLAISRDIARAMNGDLSVQSTVGVGSRFTLTLPMVPSTTRAKPPRPTPSATPPTPASTVSPPP